MVRTVSNVFPASKVAAVVLAVVLGASTGFHAGDPVQGFTEITDKVKLDFVHDAGAVGKFQLPEVMGPGGAFLDYDNDGQLDLYLVQGGALVGPGATSRPPNRLYRGIDGTFLDVTSSSGLGDRGYGMGVAVGDYDNDGWVDVYVSNLGPDRLYRNDKGKFQDVTAAAGISGDSWSASATFCDYDLDGYLDLYVTHYIRFDPTRTCRGMHGGRDYCSPQVLPAVSDTLYHNQGDGTFVDVSSQSRIGSQAMPGLGVVCGDWKGDGRMGFYVANDGAANQLWVPQGKNVFVDDALFSGISLNSFGRPEAGMGIAVGDIDLDGDFDLFVTNLRGETNTLYRNEGAVGYEDASASVGVGASSLARTGFGTVFLDVDHDGDLDLAVANGRVVRYPALPGAPADPHWKSYAEPNAFLLNDGKGTFQDISSRVGVFASQVEISRGLAVGDIDGDGDLDLLVVNTAGPARLYRNDFEKKGHWLMVKVLDPALRRDAYGAVVTVRFAGKDHLRVVQPGSSYLSSHDPRVHFGLPGDGDVEGLTVRWIDGTVETFPGGPPDRFLTVRKGQGRKPGE